MKIPGIVPTTIDPGVKQKLDSLSRAVGLPTATAYSVNFPPANASSRGNLIVVRDALGVDTLYVCLLSSTGSYSWVQVAASP